MKKAHVWFSALIISLGTVTAIALDRPGSTTTQQQAADAAFRDGAYRGHLAALRGEAPNSSTSRWATLRDQASFANGYEQSFRQTASTRAAKSSVAVAAYRDGLYVGKLQAEQGRTARLSTSRWSTERDRAAFANGYLEAYGIASAARNTTGQTSQDMIARSSGTR
jgi:uncharacterized protein with FMN-binding domain